MSTITSRVRSRSRPTSRGATAHQNVSISCNLGSSTITEDQIGVVKPTVVNGLSSDVEVTVAILVDGSVDSTETFVVSANSEFPFQTSVKGLGPGTYGIDVQVEDYTVQDGGSDGGDDGGDDGGSDGGTDGGSDGGDDGGDDSYTGECSSDADCPSSLVCSGGNCVPETYA